jgi:HD-GYP domain-containing protein (c-di-GMP phosphodiesterase class II)
MQNSATSDFEHGQEQSPHYVRAVTEMGNDREIVAREDIFAANGMKLVAKGAHVNQSQFERLSMHKLRTPLDVVLATDRPVDTAQLVADANKLLTTEPLMSSLATRSGDPLGFRQLLSALHLPTPLGFRLTVMCERRNDAYWHTLRVALIAHSLAVLLKLPDRQRHELLLASLCHDLGEMHTDPDLIASHHRITPEERRFIHVHPITGYVLLRGIPGVPAASMQAVLHHHERLDGSGYPYGLTDDKIHPLGKLLCVAEVMEAVVRRHDPQRLDVLLRLNRNRLDSAAMAAVHDLFPAGAHDAAASHEDIDPAIRLAHVTQVHAMWQSMRGKLVGGARKNSALEFLDERMMLLQSLVLQTGINPLDVGELLNMARGDADVLTELQAALGELDWLMEDIANEIVRRAPVLDAASRQSVDEIAGLLRTAS